MNQTKPTYKQQGNVGLFDSDETMEKLNKLGNPLDKLSFRDFLGLASGDKVPDEKTIWAFKEGLTKKGLFGQLFNEFYAFLEENNLILHEGTMIDGSFVEAPRQHNTREENKIIKEDRGDELWNPEEGDTEEEKNTYIGKGVKRVMRKFGMKDKVIKRNTRGKKISKWQETINRKNSKLRVRVEHVFGYMEECLHGMSSRVVGFARNAAFNTLTNLVYNLPVRASDATWNELNNITN